MRVRVCSQKKGNIRMSSLNKVYLIGNLTKDPESKQFNSGATVANLRLAFSESFTSKAGDKKESVCYVDVVVWGRQAETCKQYLHKGSPVMVEGRLQLDEWEKDGQKNSRLKVNAERVQFLGGGKGERRDESSLMDVSGGAPSDDSGQAAGNGDEGEPPF